MPPHLAAIAIHDFEYEHITEHHIRLLRVLPERSEGDLIQCELWHAARDDTKYYCLSYLWGSEDYDQDIIVNNGTLRVRHNLWSFLDEASRMHGQPAFWVDAICIDQTNKYEKSLMVAMMNSIYASAGSTCTWLGPESPSLHMRQKVSTYNKNFEALNVFNHSWDPDEEDFRMHTLLTHEYFNRSWIFQETLLASEWLIMIGEKMLNFPSIVKLAATLQERGLNERPEYQSARQLIQDYYLMNTTTNTLGPWHGHRFHLRELLLRYPRAQCSEHEDRIYSLLGLAVEGRNFSVSYGQEREAMLLHTLQHCAEECVCFVWPLWKTLRASDQDVYFFTEPKYTVPVFKIFANENGKTMQFWEDHSTDDGPFYMATITLNAWSDVPCHAQMIFTSTDLSKPSPCINIQILAKGGTERRDCHKGNAPYAFYHPPTTESEACISLSEDALLAMAPGFEDFPHECLKGPDNSTYRLLPLPYKDARKRFRGPVTELMLSPELAYFPVYPETADDSRSHSETT